VAEADWLGSKVGGHAAHVLQLSNELSRRQCRGHSAINIPCLLLLQPYCRPIR